MMQIKHWLMFEMLLLLNTPALFLAYYVVYFSIQFLVQQIILHHNIKTCHIKQKSTIGTPTYNRVGIIC